MLSYGDAAYGYTPNGSLKYKALNGDTTWYNYDLLGNLVSVTFPNGDFIQYLIDGQNRRVGKVVNGEFKKGWLYQDQLNPVAEIDSSVQVVSRFVYGTKGHVPDYMIKGDSTYRFITDHLGSVRLVVNAEAGRIAQRLDYDEFGNVLVNTNEGFQPFGYAGGLTDNHINLVRFGTRDYDASVGRWTKKDPLGFEGGSFNFLTYCYNSPINAIDPTGLRVWYADPCSEGDLKPLIIEMMQSKKGRELLKILHAREETYYLHNKPHPIYYKERRDEYRAGKEGNHVWLDPTYAPYILTTEGELAVSSPTRNLAHELGHLERYDNIKSLELEQQNIIDWENPVMRPIDKIERDPKFYGRLAKPIIFTPKR